MRHAKVLIFDDDPLHLEINGLLIQRAGYDFIPVLVHFSGTEIPRGESVRLVMLDYKLNSLMTATEIAREVRVCYPSTPILLLSNACCMPAEIAPYVDGFIRKGEPHMLLQTLGRLTLPPSPA